MSKVLKVTTAVAAAFLLASCGGDGNGSKEPGGGGDGGGGVTTLTTIDNAFQPSSLTAASGSDLEVSNEGATIHNFTIEGSDVSQDVEAGQSVTVVVDVDPGEYTMFCEYHRTAGMEGVITVQ